MAIPTGEISISLGNHVIISKHFEKGVLINKSLNTIENKSENHLIPLMLNQDNPPINECSLTTVHNCVANKIEAMNWIEYAICLN